MCIIYTLKRITQPLKIYHYCYFKLREFYTPAKGDPAPAQQAPSPFEYFGFVFCKLDCITCIYIHGKCILLATLTKEKHRVSTSIKIMPKIPRILPRISFMKFLDPPMRLVLEVNVQMYSIWKKPV